MIMLPIRRNNQEWIPSIFNELFDNEWPVRSYNAPAMNVIEGEKEYKVEIATPGMTKEDFHIHLDDDETLVIKMEKKNEKEDKKDNKAEKYLRKEFNYVKFEQSLVLPDDVDKEKISAGVTDGILSITLPKMAPKEVAKVNRVIEIK